jgi:GNAT superfamily N-acetyltransferase
MLGATIKALLASPSNIVCYSAFGQRRPSAQDHHCGKPGQEAVNALEHSEQYPEAVAGFRRHLGGGLVQRWSTSADTERIAHLAAMVWRETADEPPNPRVKDEVCRQLRGDFPFMGTDDCALIEDTSRPGSPIVACASLWHREWTYEGIPFAVGQPETVATDPDYRNRGLIRTLIAMVHARSVARNDLIQIINGIPHFYRQFGYEYALDFGGRRVTYLSLIPRAGDTVAEPYTLRLATLADVPQIMELANRRRETGVVWYALPDDYWRYQIAAWDEPEVRTTSPVHHGIREQPLMIVDSAGTGHGFVLVAGKRYSTDLPVYALEIAPDTSLPDLVPALLRALQHYGEQLPAVRPSTPPFREISFHLGRTHALYEALGQELAPFYEPPYAWYIRVPDLPAFLRHIAPALERRLVGSAAAWYTGDVTLDFYRGGLRLHFDTGKLAQIDSWHRRPFGPAADASIPALMFLQLLFGYRSLTDLRLAFPDVQASDRGQLLLDALFPTRVSWVLPL